LFSLELAAITLCINGSQLAGRTGLAGFIRDWGALILRGVVVFSALFLTFACLKFQSRLVSVGARIAATPIHPGLLAAHAIALGFFGFLSSVLYANGLPGRPELIALVWLATGLAALGLGAAAFVRPALWSQIVRSTGYLWALALLAALAAALGGNAMRLLWPRATKVTFFLVGMLLRPAGSFFGDPATMTMGNRRFSVEISDACSGLEGLGLILSFTIVWLVLFRRECRFPQALILLPAGMTVLFLLNSVRIAALILIGSAGFEDIALGGFHSQAGWLAFNVVALGICMAAREISWFSRRVPARAPSVSVENGNPTMRWVLPFLAILATGMASRAMSADFEWLYPLKFLVAAAVLWIFRRQYADLDWRIGWTGPLAGLLVFAIWIGLDRSVPAPMPPQFAAATSTIQFAWLTFRILAAITTVPIAEELAFRGFLLRRFISPEFAEISFRKFSWFAVLASSVIFGALHGHRWIAGSLAGLVYALSVIRTGRLGNAVVAHVTTNALLAVDVLVFHRWDLW
jgi:exosortase E/protease (VPEID-CTERM system)